MVEQNSEQACKHDTQACSEFYFRIPIVPNSTYTQSTFFSNNLKSCCSVVRDALWIASGKCTVDAVGIRTLVNQIWFQLCLSVSNVDF